MDEQGNQTLQVESGTGASAGGGLDAGTDAEQTNRQPSEDSLDENESSPTTDVRDVVSATATATDDYDYSNDSGYGAGDPRNAAGGSTSGGAGSGVDFPKTNQPDSDIVTGGASNTGEVTRDDS